MTSGAFANMRFAWHFIWLQIYLYLSVHINTKPLSSWLFARYWYFGQTTQELNPLFMKEYYARMYQRLLDSWGPQE